MAALSGPPTVRQNHHSAMITFVLTLEDALRCRFSISPVGEVIRLARAIVRSSRFSHGAHVAWIKPLHEELASLQREQDLRPLFTLLRAPYYPDFLLPMIRAPVADVGDELTAIGQTPKDEAQRQIERSLAMLDTVDREVADQLRDRKALERLAGIVEGLWSHIVAPNWPRLQDVLERDVLYRSRELARG